ncbi:MAG TPA: VOC family protein [Actinomycetota bacterium]|nr:VOC family protein [Actinomycetota bacterium]
MQLEGIHHITCITADAPRNVEFYVGTMGLRMVKKSVNQDDPSVYHLFYADESGSAGSDITFFEYPGVPRGRAGAGMIHTIVWRVGSTDSLDFWADRLRDRDIVVERSGSTLRFSDPEGLTHELKIDDGSDTPLRATHGEIPSEHALLGFDAARAYSDDMTDSAALLATTLGANQVGTREWEIRGATRGGRFTFDAPPSLRGLSGAGTVHHIAWASEMADHDAWRAKVAEAGVSVTPVIDRFWFRSIYFREPSGVLFEIATLGPGFTTDEPLEALGEKLTLPPTFEPMRAEIERTVTPLPDPTELRHLPSRA